MKEILIPLNFTTNPTVYDTKQSFSASDEASWVLTFTTTADVAGTVASLTIRNASENANRQTVLIDRLDVNTSPFRYALKNPLPFGQYEGTVLLKKNLTVIASASFLFGVNSSLSAEVLPDLVKAYSLDELVENVETEVSNLKDAFHLTVSETVKGVNKTERSLQVQENVRYLNEHTRKTNEQARIAAELQRKVTFDALVASEVIEQEVAEKYQEMEETYANRLLSNEQQLVDKVGGGKLATLADLSQDVKTAMTGGSVAVVGDNTVVESNIVDRQVSARKVSFLDRNSNNLLYLNDGTFTVNGITAKVTDGQITLNGTASATAFITLRTDVTLSNALYWLKLFNQTLNADVSLRITDILDAILLNVGATVVNASTNATLSTPMASNGKVVVRVTGGVTLSNFVLKPMVSRDTNPKDYENYHVYSPNVKKIKVTSVADNSLTEPKYVNDSISRKKLKVNARSSYPFDKSALLPTYATVDFSALIDAVQDIRLFGADLNDEYWLYGYLSNYTGRYAIQIYSVSTNQCVCSFDTTDVTEITNGRALYKMSETFSSGITGSVVCDFTKLSDSYYFANTVDTLLDSKCIVMTKPKELYKYLLGYVACIGDSLTQGYVSSAYGHTKFSYPYFLGKIINGTVANYGASGFTALNMWDEGISQNLYSLSNKQSIILWLGTNAGFTDTLVADTTITEGQTYLNYANTNTGSYCKIIERIKEVSPSAKIYLCTIFSGGSGVDIPVSNSVIRQIAAKYSLPVIDMNVTPFTEAIAAGAMHPIDNHFQDVGYLTVAEYIKDSICDIISKKKSAYNLVGGKA